VSRARPADPEAERARQVEELRLLIRQAHEAVRDLRAALRDARKLTDEFARGAEAAAHAAAAAELGRWQSHVQAEMNRSAKLLNAAIERAREHIVKTLVLEAADVADDGTVRAVFAAPKFDDDVPVLGDGVWP
jgi:hypothetical protein